MVKLVTWLGYLVFGLCTVVCGNILYSVICAKIMEKQAKDHK
jgi:hypothetical protein